MKKTLLNFLWVLLLISSQAYAQNRTVTGVVTGKDDGLPIPGVSVKVTGTTIGSQTGSNGQYSLNVPTGTKSLEFSFIGYAPLIGNIGNNNVLNIVLVPSTRQLSEVIVGAGGLAASRKSQGTAITTIKSDQLTEAKATNIAAGLLGKVAGLQISGTTGGANPSFRVILRGQRSLTGNNEALIVLDNIIVPNALLGNLNPEDIQDIQVLQGASAAALYGSDASNGALIITTKKGQKGKVEIKAQQTLTVEAVAFFPKLQKKYGSGSTNDVKTYLAYENQQYGPAFDGVERDLGLPLANGSIQRVPYAYQNDKNDFWENGLTNQTDLSLSSGDDKGTLFMSGQYNRTSSTLPTDIFTRANARISGTRNLTNKLLATYSLNYTQNRYDRSSTGAGTIYDQLLNSPSQAPILSYKDWKNNPYADPSGFFNAYYNNPYFQIDNNRNYVRNDYLTSSIELKYSPAKWVDLLFRNGLATRDQSDKSTSDIYRFNDYIKARPEVGNYKKTDLVGSVTDGFFYSTRITNEFQATFKKQISDFKFNLVTAAFMRQDRSKDLSATVNGLVQAGLFNLGNSTNPPTATEVNYLARQQAVYGVLNIAFKDYLFLNATARNDWFSILAPSNRSFFYPSVNLSFIPTDAIPILRNIDQIDYVKVRAGYSKVGNVNIGTTTDFGAYRLDPTFVQGAGYPYNGVGGLTLSNTIVSTDLKPEFTYTFETGAEMSFLKERIGATITYYHNRSTNQTVSASVSTATGYSTYLLNAGQTSGYGIESNLNLTPVKTKDLRVDIGGNYTYSQVVVDYLLGGLPNINISGGTPGIYGIAGRPYPVLQGTGYVRDDQGRVVVNRVTGYPSPTTNVVDFGSTRPDKVLGLNLNVTYKGITLTSVAEYRAGYVFYAGAGTGLDFNGAGINTVAYDRERFIIPNSSYLLNGVYVPNTNVTVRDGGPAYWTISGPRTGINENYIIPGNFWKVREIAIAYALPKALLNKSKVVKAVRVSAQGRNLFIFTPKTNVYGDPEYSSNTTNNGNGIGLTALSNPPSRYFGGTISLTF